jgi:hypothetical protein
MAGPKMKATLPAGDGNGLTAIIHDMTANPQDYRVVIAIVDTYGVNHLTDTAEQIPTIRVRRIEAITDRADMDLADTLMRRAMQRRNLGGEQEELPFDIEQDLQAAFGDQAGP